MSLLKVSRVRIEGFLDARSLMQHHYEDAIQLIHIHYIGSIPSVGLLREGKICHFFFACESREDKVFITFEKNFMVLNRVVTSPLVGNYRRPESRLANR